MFRVALVGCGTIGSVHAAGYLRMANATLVGIVDIRENHGRKMAKRFDTQWYSSLQQILEAEEVDVVDVCVPTYLHRSIVEQAARAGKHVICEKPIARTLDDAEAIIRICSEYGIRLFIAQVLRFFPQYRQTHELLEAGAMGSVGTARAMRGGGFPQGWNDWYASVERSGTLVVDMIIHDFDFLRWCFGEVQRVYAKGLLGRELNRLDHAFVSLRFQNGVIAHVEGTWAYPSGFRTMLEVAGTEGVLEHRSDEEMPIHLSLRQNGTETGGVAVPESPLDKDPYQLELEHFLSCIETASDALVTPHDAYKALEISLAALKSIQTGEPVELGGSM
ncbi:Gfo/Idh/MocA family protein [Alicyclobacillus dauci]|uniref:Gfo/Idh/MocA family oxidoreductase n=1 Tax=Alicyclobacillus dauci TaxID=1475485 RepID=A0ABY6Z0S0_9BACL|nr:Gfo/Idh/MocA family oxidoreductase [Alicyclobacillus dauci]WAH35570.1 Gfo/Idh/MocA family oxidoreductase [Alicyclobacillus dauci]